MEQQETSTWGEAFARREAMIRQHPLYPVLWRKVARAEADQRRPIRWRHRNSQTYGWSDTIIVRSGYGPPRPMDDAYRFAKERMLTDVFPQPWLSEGDMLAAIYVAARNDVRDRLVPGGAR